MDKPRILLVDDDIEFVSGLQRKFINRGFKKTVFAESGPKALDIMSRQGFDVAILDVRMPEMDGLKLLVEICSKWPGVETILLTGYATVPVAVEGMRKGAYDFLIKPASMDVLEARVNAAFAKKIAHDELKREKDTASA